jgi:ferredoxin
MEAKVNQETCIGCGLCISTAPSVFRMGDDGKAEAFSQPAAEEEAAVREAIDACPVSAISEE